jgi:hypothetical protein
MVDLTKRSDWLTSISGPAGRGASAAASYWRFLLAHPEWQSHSGGAAKVSEEPVGLIGACYRCLQAVALRPGDSSAATAGQL